LALAQVVVVVVGADAAGVRDCAARPAAIPRMTHTRSESVAHFFNVHLL
jgi:hypothetical protein